MSAFHADMYVELGRAANYAGDLDRRDLWNQMLNDRIADLFTYRNKTYKSVHTGIVSVAPQINFLDNFDDSIGSYLKT